MKRTIIAIVAALALPTAALAADSSTKDSASAACKAEKAGMGAATFKATYGGKANAFGKCVSARTKTIAAAKTNAAQQCKAEMDAAGGKPKGSAYGKCVSGKVKKATTDETKARVNAAKTCKAAKKADAAAFATAWGSGKNAFGKCVSATARAKNDSTTTSS